MGKPIPSVASDIALAHRALYRFLLTSFINIPQDSHDLLSQVFAALCCCYLITRVVPHLSSFFYSTVVFQLASLWFGSLTPFACKAYIDGSETLLNEKVDKPEIELKPVATSALAAVSVESFRSTCVINAFYI
jgi:hypothetical protein